jgi:transcriptional regulator with XRE-family HTH domain
VRLPKLRALRQRRGLSQQALSELAGVSRDGIVHYEADTREAHPSTAKKLAEALEVEVVDLTEEAQKVEVEVGQQDAGGIYRGEILRFTGEWIDGYEASRDVTVELYKSADGYRVYREDHGTGERALYPHEVNRFSGETEYPLYTAVEVADEWPAFGATVGRMKVRDID